MINSFRCSDLVSLLGSVGRNRSGRKQELQVRALQILKDPDPDINLDGFKRKIKELYKAAQYVRLIYFLIFRLLFANFELFFVGMKQNKRII